MGQDTLTLNKVVSQPDKAQEPVKRAVREERIPVSRGKDILSLQGFDKDPDKEYYWVNTNTAEGMGRVDRFKAGGWEIVPKQPGMKVGDLAVDRGSLLGSAITHTRGNQTLLLMAIPKKWWEEDQMAKQAKVDATEATMNEDLRQGRFPMTGSNERGSYVPDGGGMTKTITRTR